MNAATRGSGIEQTLEISQRCSAPRMFGYTFVGAIPKRCCNDWSRAQHIHLFGSLYVSDYLETASKAIVSHFGAVKIFIGTTISYAAGYLAYRGYTRKSGLRLRGSYGTTSTVECADDFVRQVTIENLKDRAVTIFAIYLRLGYNVYVVVEEFGNTPLILKPFETYHKEYDAIEFYTFNMRRLSIDELLKNPTVPRRLILSTSDGRYVVRK